MAVAEARAAKQGKAELAQRRAARPDSSAWVAASAGTGKTKVLTDRVLSLMLHGTPPGRILCLTFTKAAAAEMANRLADRLAGWAADDEADVIVELRALLGRPPDADTVTVARQLFARVLDVPGGMKILTIHAFCQSLLGRFPLEAGVPPHFQVLDETSAAEMLEAAREEVLGRASSDAALGEAVAEVTAHAQEIGFTALMAELIRERGRFARLRAAHGGVAALTDAVYRALRVERTETAETILEAACDDQALDLMGLRFTVEAMLNKGSKTDQTHGASIAAWLDDPDGRAARFDDYLGAFFTQGGQGDARKTLIHKGALDAAPGADGILESEAARLDLVRARLRALAVAQATAALLRLGGAILAAYERHKRARALLDYDDLILETRELLSRSGIAPWVLFKLDGGLDHVLIDEAQDTNPDQWSVVEALTAEFFVGEGRRDYPRTVFAVGDAKQSIFSFQRADPAAFAAMRTHFAGKARDAQQRLEQVALDVSFRSTAAVLQAVDCIFASETASDGVLFGEAAVRHDPVRVGQAGLVELWPPADPAEAEDPEPWTPPLLQPLEAVGSPARPLDLPPRARLARLIAWTIWHWTRDPAGADDPGSWLASRERRLRPEDFLVLVRRRNEFVEELVRELKQLEVPVAGVDRMVLTDQLAVMDLIALGRCLLLPEDDLTLATVLKGPIVGLDEDRLFDLAHDRAGTLWAALRDRAGGDPALAAAHRLLAGLQARADFVRPFELYAEVLGPGRGRERLLARLGPDANDPIEEFLNLALLYEREQVPSLEGFLHWLEAGAQEVKRDLEDGQDVVRVMTVHGAKGLQAPVVFLPDTLQVPQDTRGLLWPEGRPEGGRADKDTLLLWPLRKGYDGPVAAAARAAARRAQEQEYRRLLYVAMTRAEDRLYVCGWNSRRGAPAGCWYKLIEQALPAVAEAVDFDFAAAVPGGWAGPGWRLRQPQVALPEMAPPETELPAPAVPLPPWAADPPPPEPQPPRPLAPSRPAEAEPPVRSPLGPDEGYRYHRGRIVHRLLQSLPDLAPESRPEAARRYLAQPLHELTAEQQEAILAETLAVLENPDFAPLFGPGSRAEVPLVGLVASAGEGPPQVVSGQLDRLLVTDEAVIAADYKTNRPPPAAEADVPSLYLRQMAGYRAVLQKIYPDRPVRCCLLWTDAPRLMQLSDAALTGHEP